MANAKKMLYTMGYLKGIMESFKQHGGVGSEEDEEEVDDTPIITDPALLQMLTSMSNPQLDEWARQMANGNVDLLMRAVDMLAAEAMAHQQDVANTALGNIPTAENIATDAIGRYRVVSNAFTLLHIICAAASIEFGSILHTSGIALAVAAPVVQQGIAGAFRFARNMAARIRLAKARHRHHTVARRQPHNVRNDDDLLQSITNSIERNTAAARGRVSMAATSAASSARRLASTAAETAAASTRARAAKASESTRRGVSMAANAATRLGKTVRDYQADPVRRF